MHIVTEPFHLHKGSGAKTLEKRGLTIIHPFYNDDVRLRYQIENWKTWPSDVLENVKVIIVDDHSDTPVHSLYAGNEVPGLDLRIYRIQDNLKFNTPGALNLGVSMSNTGYFVFMDSDCMLERPAIEKLLTLRPDPCFHYWFPRKRVTNVESPAKYNVRYLPCAILTNKTIWEMVGGMDEDFTGEWSGGYAYFDSYLQWSLFQHRFAKALLQDVPITEYLEDIVGPNVQQREGVKASREHRTNKKIMYGKIRGDYESNPKQLRFRWDRTYPAK